MKNRIRSLFGLTILFVLGSAAANAQPVLNGDNGHHYEAITALDISPQQKRAPLEAIHDSRTGERLDGFYPGRVRGF